MLLVLTCWAILLLLTLPSIGAYVAPAASVNSRAISSREALTTDNDPAPTTFETALLQYGRLFSRNTETADQGTSLARKSILQIRAMPRNERIFRILLSWSLLICAKSVALLSPLYFKSLIERAATLGSSEFVASGNLKTSIFFSLQNGIESLIHASALGLMIGYGATRLASGFIQLSSELILSPVTTTVSEILPKEVVRSTK